MCYVDCKEAFLDAQAEIEAHEEGVGVGVGVRGEQEGEP